MGAKGLFCILYFPCRAEHGDPVLIYLKLFPLTGDSDKVTHFMGVLIDLPLTQVHIYIYMFI
jgi:hypothetical protein